MGRISTNAAGWAAWPAILATAGSPAAIPPSTTGARSRLERLEEERRKIYEAEKAFYDYLEGLRQAKDREEFERFMASRAASSAPQGQEPKNT